MNFTYPSKRNITKQKADTNIVLNSIAVVGSIINLPFQEELLKIIETTTSTEKAKRIIIVDPEQSLLNRAIKHIPKHN